ncbi:hypothetical protein ANRL4_00585 [Anaerolineae bacterium]|nr:hypothetical protein ANRL4_00585 [Anaerolineae bacterium]
MQVRQKLSEFESTIAIVVGGGLSLIMLSFLLASASGANDRLTMMIIVGALMIVGGIAAWLFTSKPWTKHDDWSEPLFTGHDHGHDATFEEPDPEDLPHHGHQEGGEAHAIPLALAQAEPKAITSPAPSAIHAAIVEADKPAEAPKSNETPAPTKFESPVPSPDYAPNLPAVPQTPPTAPPSVVSESVKTAMVETAKPAEAPKSNETPAPTKFESPVPSPDYAPNLPAVPQTPPSAVSEVEKAAPDEAPKAAETPEPDDDLTNIEGIGPKIAATLRAAGVKRFGQLAQMKPEDIEKIVKSAGVRMVGKAETFPAQAQLAAEGKWDELKKLTDHLRGGRAVHDEEK